MKIKICTPYYNVIHPETLKSIEALKLSGIDFVWDKCMGTLIAEARNALVNGGQNSLKWQTIGGDWTHILCLDADISFTPDQLLQLIDRDLPVVSGAYIERKDPSKYCGGWYEMVSGNLGKMLNATDDGLTKVDWAGAGFILIKRHVFEKMPYPWFRHEWIHYDHEGKHYQTQSGDDLSFCLQAQKHGFGIYCDCDCVVTHHIQKEMSMTGPEKNVAKPVEQPKTITVSKAILATSSKFHSASSVVSKAFSYITDLCDTLDGVIDNKNSAIEALEKEVAMLKEANKVVLLKLTKLEGVDTVPDAEVVPEA